MTFLHHIVTLIATPFIAMVGLFSVHQPVQLQVSPAAVIEATTTPETETNATSSTSEQSKSPVTVQSSTIAGPQAPYAQTQKNTPEPGSITCNGIYYPPCTDGGTRVCLENGSNAYCRPPEPPAPPIQSSPQTFAPQATPQPPPNTTFCNGKYWNQCAPGTSLVCPSSGDAYCQAANPLAPIVPQDVTPTPQPIEQIWMDKFLADATNADDSIQKQANDIVSGGGPYDCSSAPTMAGKNAAICDFMQEAESPIVNLETWATSVKNPYRSAYCDHELYLPMEQILQDELNGFNNLVGCESNYGACGGTASAEIATISRISNSTDSAVNGLFKAAQLVASSCQ